MSTPILATKLYIPPLRPKVVHRPRLLARLHDGVQGKVTLISAPAGYGKTTLISSWIQQKDEGGRMKDEDRLALIHPSSLILHPSRVAWLSLDELDNDPARFLTHLVAALQTVAANVGEQVLAILQSPQPPPAAVMLTTLLNDLTTVPHRFILVLDDYHVIESPVIDRALTFLIEHLPPQMHLVIATRADPDLPLARLRVRSQLTEVRAADLRFTPAEAADFLNQVMGLQLTAEAIAALESRTEGWIAGLQLAALSMLGQQDATNFIKSFTGSHRFVLDYLVEEVLQQQPEHVQTFLLRTSILDRLCGPLCDAVVGKDKGERMKDEVEDSSFILSPSSLILEQLERANLFIVPLDNERHWYRYHHLFAELLRQRLPQNLAAEPADVTRRLHELHIRASQWYEDNGLVLEAFHHAAAANDLDRAERLIEGTAIPRHFRGAVTTILAWLASLPVSVLQARPALWWRYAALLLVNGQTVGVAEKLQAAEEALQDRALDDKARDLLGRIAAAKAVFALTRYQVETILTQARRALAYLHPNNLATRANTNWVLGVAYQFQGDRAAARQAHTEAIALSQAAGDTFTTILATIGLGNVQEADNQLHLAVATYERVLQLAGNQPLQIIHEAHLGLARILYEWNDLVAATPHAHQSLHLARQYDRVIDRFILCEIFLARLQLAQGDLVGAAARLAQTDQTARQQNFSHRLPDVAVARVGIWLRQGNVTAAAQLAQEYKHPISQARVYLAQGNAAAALALLAAFRQQIAAKGWADEDLRALVLQAVALAAHGETAPALQRLAEALALAEPGGFIRLFVDEGAPMAQLLTRLKHEGGRMKVYIEKLLTAFGQPEALHPSAPTFQPSSASLPPLLEPLSQRELEVLRLIAQGLSNEEISQRLFLALSTVKGHNRIIFDKLQVQRRTEAVARARALGLL